MSEQIYDVIVIGGGPGGYVAAIRAGQLGLKTLVVEKEAMGGVCLNWGCIPSKALIHAAGLVEKIRHAEKLGITTSGLAVDVPAMQRWKDGIVDRLTKGVSQLVRGAGGQIAMGTARIVSAKRVAVTGAEGDERVYEARKGIVVATGTEVIRIPGFEPDGEVVVTAREAVSLQQVPKRMLVVGGGVIGLELGTVYHKLGCELTVVELTDQLLPGVDPDLVKVVHKRLEKRGARILLGAKASGLERTGAGARVTVLTREGKEESIEVDKVLVAVGFRPNSRGFGLEELGVALDERGHVRVDERFQSSVPGIYAIGDVCGPPYLAHKASKEGEIAVEVIAGKKSVRDWRAMPAAIFTDPEVATVGLSERQAKEQGRQVLVGKFPFSASGRAMAVTETDGFVKVIADAAGDHEILGIGIVGPEASDLISEGALAMEMCAFAEDVALTVHPHPTLGETMMEAAKHALGEAIHIPNRRR